MEDERANRYAIIQNVSKMPTLQPMRLTRRSEPFDHPDWVYEIKFDGFRALA
jgi:bifunctional non-homologous end joining protein LigD